MKKIILSILLLQLFSCQKNDNKTVIKILNNTTMEIPKCLQPQLMAGYSAEKSETDYPNYTYNKSDLDCSIPLLEKELQKRSFKFSTPEEFSKKVLQVFGRRIDFSKSSKYVYINGDDPCIREILFNKNSDDEMVPKSYYLVKNKSFITELLSIPEIIDYSKDFPAAKKIEEQIDDNQGDIKITKWDEIKNLSQIRYENIEKFVNRNLFLFNNKNEQLTWLLFNDEKFLEILCKVYGYDKNEKINQHFIKKIIASKEIDKNSGFFYHKSCDGKVIMNENFINSYKSFLDISKKPNEALILKNIASHIMSSNKYEELSKDEKVKIVCYLANVYDPLFKTYHNDANWGNLTILADAKDYFDSDWNDITSIIVKNNYYNLPNLKMALEYANQFDSVGAPD